MIFDNMPYSNFHEFNLDWIIAEMKRLKKRIEILEHRCDLIEQHLAELDARCDGLQEQITTLNNQLIALKGRVTTCENKIAALENRVQKIEDIIAIEQFDASYEAIPEGVVSGLSEGAFTIDTSFWELVYQIPAVSSRKLIYSFKYKPDEGIDEQMLSLNLQPLYVLNRDIPEGIKDCFRVIKGDNENGHNASIPDENGYYPGVVIFEAHNTFNGNTTYVPQYTLPRAMTANGYLEIEYYANEENKVIRGMRIPLNIYVPKREV